MPRLAITIHRPLKIIIEAVDHQRYSTAGDWQIKPDDLYITVSKMSDQRYGVPRPPARRQLGAAYDREVADK